MCHDSDCQTALIELGITVAKVVGGNGAQALFLAIGPEGETYLSCDGFEAVSDLVYFDVVGGGDKHVVLTLLGVGGDPEAYEVCFGGEAEFTQANGDPAVWDGRFWVGLLPNCEVPQDPPPAPQLAPDDLMKPPPCVGPRALDPETGDVTLVVVAPPGDPLVKIG